MINDDLNQKLNELIIKKTNELNKLKEEIKLRNNLKKYFKKIAVSLYFIGGILAFLFYLKWGLLGILGCILIDIITLKGIEKGQNNYLNKKYPLPKIYESNLREQINYLKDELAKINNKNLDKEDNINSYEDFYNNKIDTLVRKLIKKDQNKKY